MSAKHVLTLAYHFPPVGGAGVQRMLQLSRRLPALGWEQTVITGPGSSDSSWRPRDDLAGPGTAGATNVLRMAGPEPPHDVPWEGRLERWLRVSSRWRRWWGANVVTLADSIDRDVDVVHASVAPYSTAESAVRVARLLGRPLVLDLEDPWALDEMMVYPSRAHRRLERRRMGRVLRAADVVVMNTPEARRRVLEVFTGLAPEQVVSIPNAFDPDDFRTPAPSRDGGGTFRLVHTGSLHTEMGRRHRAAGRMRRLIGGAMPGVDFLSRSHVYLLEAVAGVLGDDPTLTGAVEVHLAGVFSGADRDVAARYPFVRLHEFVPHAETITLLRSAEALFLPMHELPPGTRAGLVPHKTYEYLAAGRPIVAAVPDGDARDLLEASGIAQVCRPSDVGSIKDAVRREIERWRAGEAAPGIRPDVLARCGADRMSREITDVYSRLSASRAG